MRADNDGEGGILALMSLVTGRGGGRARILLFAGLFGAALIYGDGIITPAISVLSAIEGVNVATSAFKPFVVPLAATILVVLFMCQRFGTARIGVVFGPIMLVWFITIGALGLVGVVRQPAVLGAVNPLPAVHFLFGHGFKGFAILGSVLLAITGGEALYADMGQFGRGPIRISWYAVALPSLLLSYAGQTASLLDGKSDGNPFFNLVPSMAIYPMVLIASLATIIASQAIITGTFSLTRQAMQLGWFPGLMIKQTSDTEYGQIYVPIVNYVMMTLTLVLTISFGSSDRLTGAYGTAVSTTMLLTTLLLFRAMVDIWRWPKLPSLALCVALAIVDLAFFSANLLKIADGGWIPLLFGAVLFLLMLIWRRGTDKLRAEIETGLPSRAELIRTINERSTPRVPGSAVFLTSSTLPVSPVMAEFVNRIGVLPETVIALTVRFADAPRVLNRHSAEAWHEVDGLWSGEVTYGFMETPNLPAALADMKQFGCHLDLEKVVFYGGYADIVARLDRVWLSRVQTMIFSVLFRNAVRAIDRFALPSGRYVALGRRVAL
jgi:KUP system potassium uptake protein